MTPGKILLVWALAAAFMAQTGVLIVEHKRLVEVEARVDQLDEDVNDSPICGDYEVEAEDEP